MSLFRRKKKKPDKTTQEIFELEVERKAQEKASKILAKSSLSGLTGEELLAAAIAGDRAR